MLDHDIMKGFALVGAMVLAVTVHADHDGVHTWTGQIDDLFQKAGNWSPAGIPDAADVALFDLEQSYDVLFTHDPQNLRLLVRDGDVSFELFKGPAEHTYTLTAAIRSIVVGELDGDNAQLRALVGTLAGVDAVLGDQDKSHGVLRLDDLATLELTGSLRVGDAGWGELHILAGSHANSVGTAHLGHEASGFGQLTVVGPHAQWNNSGQIYVGRLGDGEMLIDNAGQVTSTRGYLGRFASATGAVTVSGDGSAWHMSEFLAVGNQQTNHGSLLITGGGQVTSDGGYLGRFDAGSRGVVTVTGDDSTWTNTGSLYVGGRESAVGGSGTLNVQAGATVHVQDLLHIWDAGSVNLDGGTLRFDGYERASGGQFNYTAGTVQLAGERTIGTDATIAELYGASPSIDAGKELHIEGLTTVDTDLSVDGALVAAGTTLRIAHNSAATLTVSGDGSVSSGAALIASNPGMEGAVAVSGSGASWTIAQPLMVGYAGAGTLTIANGGTVTSTSGHLGVESTVQGSVTVTGEASSWSVGAELLVGGWGTFTHGTLTIADGGSVLAGHATIASSLGAQGFVAVTGADSSWELHGALVVGSEGDGTLSIDDGASVSDFDGYIARTPVAQGSVTLAGAGSTWTTTQNLFVGGDAVAGGGHATLNVGPGGLVDVQGTLKLWDQATINLHGGTLRFNNYDREPDAQLNYLAGTIQLAGDRQIGLGPVVHDWFPGGQITGGKTLAVEGTATLITPLSLLGGALHAGDLDGAHLIDFQTGTLRLTDATLSITAQGQLGDDVVLGANQTLHADATATIATDGRLTVRRDALFTAPTLTSHGIITGGGRLNTDITNHRDTVNDLALGEIRVTAGQRLLVDGTIANRSRIDVRQGAELEATGTINNGQVTFFTPDVPGEIYLRDATLRVPIVPISTFGPTAGLINRVGTLAMPFGDNDIFGTIFNQAEIVLSGDARASFYDHVRNDGEVRLAADAAAVWFGDVTGSGAFTGTGTHHFEGTLSPGNSTAAISFDGNVLLGPTASLILKLAGTAPGPGHDQLNVAGHLGLAGTLQLSLIDPFLPGPGHSFDLLSFGSLDGAFDAIHLPALPDHLGWNLDQLYVDGSIAVSLAMLRGDMNLDGVVDTGDVAPFVLALTDPATYLAQYGVDEATMIVAGDINGDGVFDTGDVAPFVQLLVSGGLQSVPEPGSLALLGLGGLLLLWRRGG